jgi:hypothetical protein
LAYVRGEKNEAVLTAPTETLRGFLQKNLAAEMKQDAAVEAWPLK